MKYCQAISYKMAAAQQSHFFFFFRRTTCVQVLENLPSGVDVYDLPTMQQALQVVYMLVTVDDYSG